MRQEGDLGRPAHILVGKQPPHCHLQTHAGLDWSSAALHTVLPQITESLGISISEGWSQIRGPGAPIMAGFENLETTLQYQLLKDNAHELAMLLGFAVEWGGTGATNAGIGSAYSVLTPTSSFGQGFGQLPDTIGWARPLAVTGQIGYQIPTMSYDVGQGAFIPQVLVYGASVQHSMPYLKAEVKDLQLPDFINHLIPIVELALATPVANNFGNRPSRKACLL